MPQADGWAMELNNNKWQFFIMQFLWHSQMFAHKKYKQHKITNIIISPYIFLWLLLLLLYKLQAQHLHIMWKFLYILCEHKYTCFNICIISFHIHGNIKTHKIICEHEIALQTCAYHILYIYLSCSLSLTPFET